MDCYLQKRRGRWYFRIRVPMELHRCLHAGSLFGLKSRFGIGTEEGSIDTLLAALDEQLKTL